MKLPFINTHAGRHSEIWPVLLVLMIVVLVPTACVLWFMNVAMRNERLAMRQKLEDVYRGHVLGARAVISERWDERMSTIEQLGATLQPAELFEAVVRRGFADSALCFDSSGNLIYPTRSLPVREEEPDADFQAAERLEYIEGDLTKAVDAYRRLAESKTDIHAAARALQAQARCLIKVGQRQQALDLVLQDLAHERYRIAVDMQGRSILADALLLALRIMHDRSDPRFASTAEEFKRLVGDYTNGSLASSQRRFLMHELQTVTGDADVFGTLAAEDLAARAVEEGSPPPGENGPSDIAGIWQVWTPNRRVLLLLTQADVVGRVNAELADMALPDGAILEVLPPETANSGLELPFAVAIGSELPEWQLVLTMSDQDALDTAADEQIASYLWTGMIFIAAICVVAALLGWALNQQMRVTRLKNDLVATVSHELKTPLSSMRLLVDTLLDSGVPDETRTREYLSLIATENSRLSRLIDNFLAFSRLERKKYALERQRVPPAAIVHDAIDAAGERLSGTGCKVRIDIEEQLPHLMADHDALVTALLNLLDNAYKYSGDDKQIKLRAYSGPGAICFEVADNGVGLTPRAAKRVFQKFYQVNRSLSRSTGGCGLGLSIVQFIAVSHGGSVSVRSQLGVGSTFTLRIPLQRVDQTAAEEASLT